MILAWVGFNLIDVILSFDLSITVNGTHGYFGDRASRTYSIIQMFRIFHNSGADPSAIRDGDLIRGASELADGPVIVQEWWAQMAKKSGLT